MSWHQRICSVNALACGFSSRRKTQFIEKTSDQQKEMNWNSKNDQTVNCLRSLKIKILFLLQLVNYCTSHQCPFIASYIYVAAVALSITFICTVHCLYNTFPIVWPSICACVCCRRRAVILIVKSFFSSGREDCDNKRKQKHTTNVMKLKKENERIDNITCFRQKIMLACHSVNSITPASNWNVRSGEMSNRKARIKIEKKNQKNKQKANNVCTYLWGNRFQNTFNCFRMKNRHFDFCTCWYCVCRCMNVFCDFVVWCLTFRFDSRLLFISFRFFRFCLIGFLLTLENCTIVDRCRRRRRRRRRSNASIFLLLSFIMLCTTNEPSTGYQIHTKNQLKQHK